MTTKVVNKYFYQNYTNFSLPFPQFGTDYQTGSKNYQTSYLSYIEIAKEDLLGLLWQRSVTINPWSSYHNLKVHRKEKHNKFKDLKNLMKTLRQRPSALLPNEIAKSQMQDMIKNGTYT